MSASRAEGTLAEVATETFGCEAKRAESLDAEEGRLTAAMNFRGTGRADWEGGEERMPESMAMPIVPGRS